MNNKGFTLLEIITTFTLISILLALSIPKLNRDFGYLDRMARGFIADVRYIQTESMKYPSPLYKMEVNESKNSYYIKDETNIVKAVSFKDRYAISYTGKGSLYFTIAGTPVHPGTFTIKDTKTNKHKSVTIVPATGRTIILE